MEQPDTDLTVKTVGDDFKIYGLITKIGDFQTAGDMLCWYIPQEEKHINLPVETWNQLVEIVPRVMEVMGL